MTSIFTIRVSFVLGSEPSRKHESNASKRVYSPADLLLDESNLAIMFCCLNLLDLVLCYYFCSFILTVFFVLTIFIVLQTRLWIA